MSDDARVNRDNISFEKKKGRNKWGIYISITLIVVGLIWYGVNVGIIPYSLIQEQAGPIIVVLLGLLILIKSL